MLSNLFYTDADFAPAEGCLVVVVMLEGWQAAEEPRGGRYPPIEVYGWDEKWV
ncbi:MAG: hypothetical protein J6R31_00120 [Rikenellaceae bacterium]|nr:hypothetical protein [Rikenellaceae bacterium]